MMRIFRLALISVALALSACGSIYDELPDGGFGGGLGSGGGSATGGGGGGSTGLICAADNPCTCDPCTSTSQCMSGLFCLQAKTHGQVCPDSRSVCITGP